MTLRTIFIRLIALLFLSFNLFTINENSANNPWITPWLNNPVAQEIDLTITVPNAGDGRFSVCDGERKVIVRAQNTLATPLTNVKVRLNVSALTGIAFTGTVNRLSGSNAASTVAVDNASTVTMKLSNLAPGEYIEFEVGLQALCAANTLATALTPPSFNVIATFAEGDGSDTESSGPFEVVKPALSITSAVNNANGTNVLDVAFRSIDTMKTTVANAGDGNLSNFYYWVEDHASLEIQGLRIGNITLPVFQKVGNISYFKITAAEIAKAIPGPTTNILTDFQFNEQMIFKEIWYTKACSLPPADTRRGVYYGCGTLFTDRCEESTRFAGVSFANRFPNLVSSPYNIGLNPTPACYLDANITQGSILYNKGTGSATTICFGLQTGLSGGNPQKLDTSKVFYKIKSSGIYKKISAKDRKSVV